MEEVMKKLILIIWCMMVMNSWGLFYGTPCDIEGDNLGGVTVQNGETPFPTNSVYPVPLELRYYSAQYIKVIDGKIVEKSVEEKAFSDLPIKYKKMVDGVWVEMSTQEKAAVDAAEETARQASKPQSLKNREKKAKDVLVGLGLPVPVPAGSGDAMIDALSAQIDVLLAENKIKESVELTKQIISAIFLFQMLGDDIYAPLLGEGGE
jgi:hypothetical protein